MDSSPGTGSPTSAAVQACRWSVDMPWRCKRATGARRNTTRSTPIRWRCGAAAACCPRPTPLPPPCAPPATCADDGGISCVNGRHDWRTSTIPIVSLTSRSLARSSPTKPPATAWPSGFRRRRCSQNIAVALALIGHDDPRLRDRALAVRKTATPHAAHTRDRRRTVPGIGAILRRVRRDELPDIQRFPRVPAVVSDCRLVTWAKASAGTRDGTAGTKMGPASLPWACSDAAVRCLRAHPAGQQSLARVENTPRTGQAVTVLAHHLARAVYDRFTRHTAFARPTGRRGSGEKRASRAPHGSPGASAWPGCASLLERRRRRTHRSP